MTTPSITSHPRAAHHNPTHPSPVQPTTAHPNPASVQHSSSQQPTTHHTPPTVPTHTHTHTRAHKHTHPHTHTHTHTHTLFRDELDHANLVSCKSKCKLHTASVGNVGLRIGAGRNVGLIVYRVCAKLYLPRSSTTAPPMPHEERFDAILVATECVKRASSAKWGRNVCLRFF